MIVGATICIATLKKPTDTANFDSSWAKMRAYFWLSPRPPYSLGQAIPAQPFS